jgi:hypothetical protein
MNLSPHRFAFSAFAVLALLGVLPAHAIGRLADINVIDRDSGETLAVYTHRGEHWVAGRPGARYAVSVRNALPGRVMSVVSVDGINVVSGQTAAWQQTGYVLGPWQQYDITGWRKTDSEVAAFQFTALPSSYAARTGRPAHIGVIGVALFREKVVAPPVAPLPEPVYPSWRERREFSEGGRSQLERRGLPAAPASSANGSMGSDLSSASGAPAEATPQGSAEARRAVPASAAPSLGTGHGAREHDQISRTRFERRSSQPDELIRIRYDSRENLLAMGVVPPEAVAHRPQPFPGSGWPRYVPDPD